MVEVTKVRPKKQKQIIFGDKAQAENIVKDKGALRRIQNLHFPILQERIN
jgi:hypothetical protein